MHLVKRLLTAAQHLDRVEGFTLAGMVLVVVGVGLIYLPAGVIVAGLGCIGYGYAVAQAEGAN